MLILNFIYLINIIWRRIVIINIINVIVKLLLKVLPIIFLQNEWKILMNDIKIKKNYKLFIIKW